MDHTRYVPGDHGICGHLRADLGPRTARGSDGYRHLGSHASRLRLCPSTPRRAASNQAVGFAHGGPGGVLAGRGGSGRRRSSRTASSLHRCPSQPHARPGALADLRGCRNARRLHGRQHPRRLPAAPVLAGARRRRRGRLHHDQLALAAGDGEAASLGDGLGVGAIAITSSTSKPVGTCAPAFGSTPTIVPAGASVVGVYSSR